MRNRDTATSRDTASSILQGLTLLFAVCALGVTYGDWARLGHRHASAEGILYHHHPHFGGHRHDAGDPPSKDPLAPGNESPGSSPTDPGSSEAFLASALILGLDLQPSLTVQRPDRTAPGGVTRGTAWPKRDLLHLPAIPRGPPSA